MIGGAEVFALALPKARRMYLTEVPAAPEGDVLFPPFDESTGARFAASRMPPVPKTSSPSSSACWSGARAETYPRQSLSAGPRPSRRGPSQGSYARQSSTAVLKIGCRTCSALGVITARLVL